MAGIGIKSRCMEYTLHGISISDPWFWLEDLDSAETRAWVEVQNQRTSAFLEVIPQREEIRQRITELWNYSRRSVPFDSANICDGTRTRSELVVATEAALPAAVRPQAAGFVDHALVQFARLGLLAAAG